MSRAGDLFPPQRVFSDAAAAAAVAVLTGPYLPSGNGTMRPAGMVAVLNDVTLAGRRRVVELGSGSSTVLLARLLSQRWPDGDCCQVAVEHDEDWAQWVGDQLRRERLDRTVTVVHAPLVPHPAAEDGLAWYDGQVLLPALDAALGGDDIDLLLVDGPPADTPDKVLARWPALPALVDRLAPGATVVLDDVERPGEQEVLRRWERDTGLSFDRHGAVAGIAVARTLG